MGWGESKGPAVGRWGLGHTGPLLPEAGYLSLGPLTGVKNDEDTYFTGPLR